MKIKIDSKGDLWIDEGRGFIKQECFSTEQHMSGTEAYQAVRPCNFDLCPSFKITKFEGSDYVNIKSNCSRAFEYNVLLKEYIEEPKMVTCWHCNKNSDIHKSKYVTRAYYDDEDTFDRWVCGSCFKKHYKKD